MCTRVCVRYCETAKEASWSDHEVTRESHLEEFEGEEEEDSTKSLVEGLWVEGRREQSSMSGSEGSIGGPSSFRKPPGDLHWACLGSEESVLPGHMLRTWRRKMDTDIRSGSWSQVEQHRTSGWGKLFKALLGKFFLSYQPPHVGLCYNVPTCVCQSLLEYI